MAVHSRPYLTPQDYLAIERAAETKSEYLDGEMVAMAGASRWHNLIVLNVGAELRAQLKQRPCEVYSNDQRVQWKAAKPATRSTISGQHASASMSAPGRS